MLANEEFSLGQGLRLISQINSGGVGLVVQFWSCTHFTVSQNLHVNDL